MKRKMWWKFRDDGGEEDYVIEEENTDTDERIVEKGRNGIEILIQKPVLIIDREGQEKEKGERKKVVERKNEWKKEREKERKKKERRERIKERKTERKKKKAKKKDWKKKERKKK